MVETAIFPTLFYAALAGSSTIRHSSRLGPLDKVARHCAIAPFGLLHTMSHEASQMITGSLLSHLQLRQHVMQYHLRRLPL